MAAVLYKVAQATSVRLLNAYRLVVSNIFTPVAGHHPVMGVLCDILILSFCHHNDPAGLPPLGSLCLCAILHL